MEGYELPSQGKIYEGVQVNPHVELRSMTARDEMKRLSPSTTPLKTLADIIEGCMIEKPAIHVYDMCMGDYEFLLHRLRIVTYGEKYKLTCRCSHCLMTVDGEANLGDLPVKEFDEALYEEHKTFTLPVSNKVVSLKYASPRLVETIEARAKEMKRKFKGANLDFDTLSKITCSIDTIDNISYNQFDIEKIIQDLPARDMQVILNKIDVFQSVVGIDTLFDMTCPNCGEDFTTFFRYGPEFFRPTNL
jgi:hypothetical protein